MAVLLEPMWKCTGMFRSEHTCHSGSQARLARSGDPASCGSEVMLIPRNPSPAALFVSSMQRLTSHAGIRVIGMKRFPDVSIISAMASL